MPEADSPSSQPAESLDESAAPPENLCIIWSTANRETALELVFMYALNSKLRGWWKRVKLVVWGPSARVLSEDDELRDHVFALQREGVEVWACKRCADDLGVADRLAADGIVVAYMGAPLTEMLKDGWKVLTF